MGFVSIAMGDRFSALLVSLMPLRLGLVDQNPFWPCSVGYLMATGSVNHLLQSEVPLNLFVKNIFQQFVPTY